VPLWAKIVVYIVLPIGALYAVYKIATGVLLGPVNAYKDFFEMQYKDFVDELKRYSTSDNGNLTPAHLEILKQKQKLLEQTEKGLGQISNAMYTAVVEIAAIIGAGLVLIGIAKAIISKWSMKWGGSQSGSARGASYVAICSLAEQLATEGNVLQATALATSTHNYFASVDAPFMQAQISFFQSQLQILTGFELAYAQFMIQTYAMELINIPVWYSQLPPPIIPI